MTESKAPDWVAADWGTSHLRLWLMTDAGVALRRIDATCGMATLSPAEFEPALISQLAGVFPKQGFLPVICCGMAGSRQGWAEAPYAATPCPPPSLGSATHVVTQDPRLSVHILPGIKQMDPADVMRGEETQVAGVITDQPDFDGVICLPGTHTKWVRIVGGNVQAFRTYMTGELFALLAQHSVLRHSTSAEAWRADAFAAGVADSAHAPQHLLSSLFGLRAETLLHDMEPSAARSRLSGLLIGAEVTSARVYWQNADVIIVGENTLAALYAEALHTQNVTTHILDAEAVTLAGLTAAYRKLPEIAA